MQNTLLKITIWLNYLLWLLGLRRQRQLGVVYDSVTKEPVDPVVVKLIDVRLSKVIASNIVNLKGEYGFIADPGLYQIHIQRPHYEFPSTRITAPRDGVYYPIYRGEVFEFVGGKDVISISIPLDPVAADWNQEAKRATVKTYPVLQNTLIVIMSLLFWFGFVLTGIRLYGELSAVWIGIAAVYITVLSLVGLVPRVRLWGRVLSKRGKIPASGVTVEVAHLRLPDMVIAKAATVTGGKFFIRLGRGTYIVTVKQNAPGEAPVVLGSQTVRVGSEGVINKDIYI